MYKNYSSSVKIVSTIILAILGLLYFVTKEPKTTKILMCKEDRLLTIVESYTKTKTKYINNNTGDIFSIENCIEKEEEIN